MTEKIKPFVVLEGGSGSGKTTVIESLKKKFTDFSFLREPGGTDFGELMRKAVQQTEGIEIDPMASFLAYSASRANLVAYEILPRLRGEKVSEGVFLDRYWYSSYAYQGSERVDRATIMQISKLASKGVEPLRAIYFDLDPAIAMERKSGCGDVDRYDQKEFEFHQKVREAYWELVKGSPELWRVVDASESREEVWEQTLGILAEIGIE